MEFFIYKDNRQQGPYTLGQLADIGISSETLVWREGMEQWLPAWRVAELKDVLAGTYKAEAVPPPVEQQEEPRPEPPAAAEDAGSTDGGAEGCTAGVAGATKVHENRRRSRAVVWLAVAAVAFFIMLMTCPGADKHRDAVSGEVTAALTESVYAGGDDNGMGDMLGGMLGSMITARIVDAMIGQFMKVDNYFIFSVGKIGYGGNEKTVSFGILGHVFTFGADDLREIMEDNKPLPDTMAL